MREEAVVFGNHCALTGIITYPEKDAGDTPALILITAGLIHRVGPNHMYAALGRTAAAAGFTTLRFDLSGIGDSEPRQDCLPFQESCILEVQEAMDFLQSKIHTNRFVLAGLCSGATASYFTSLDDGRAAGFILLNAQTFQQDAEEEVMEYAKGSALTRYVFSPQAWLKVFKGTARFRGKIGTLTKHLFASVLRKNSLSEKARSAAGGLFELADRGVKMLIIYSKGDRGYEYFNMMGQREIEKLRQTGKVQLEILHGTDHLFTPPETRKELFRICLDWLERSHKNENDTRPEPVLTR